MIWDSSLAAAAQAYSAQLSFTGVLEHGSTGENLYFRYPYTNQDFLVATNAWIEEEPLYSGEVIPNGPFESYGHFSESVPAWTS